MTIKDIFSLAIRLMGVYLFYGLIVSLPTYTVFIGDAIFNDRDESTYFFIGIFILLFHSLFIYYFLFKADNIVNYLASKSKTDSFSKVISIPVNKDSIAYFAVIYIGAWLVINVIPDLAIFAIENLEWRRGELYHFGSEKKLYSDLIYYGLRLLTGLAAIYFNKPIVRYILQRSEPENGKATE